MNADETDNEAACSSGDMPGQGADTLMPLEHAATMLAQGLWPDSPDVRALAARTYRQKYPGAPAPTLNGGADEYGYLANAKHEAEGEVRRAIECLLARGTLPLLSPRTFAPTRDRQGAFVSRAELVRSMMDGWHLSEPPAAQAPDMRPRIKRAALIRKHSGRWRSIERDLSDASTNGLSAQAKAPGLGWWNEDDAIAWAKSKGKLTAAAIRAPAFPSKVHKIKA